MARTVQCGQVFRWHQSSEGAWCGRDGDAEFELVQLGETLTGRATGGAAAVRRLLDLDFDEGELLQLIDATLPNLTGTASGIRLMQMQDTVEVAFSFLCSANNNLHRIVPMVKVMAESGEPFPRLSELAALDASFLRSKGFGYRGDWIPRAANEMLSRGGDRWLSDLRSATYADAFAELLSVPGFGPKLSDCVLLYGLGHTEAFPIDTHVWKALAPVLFSGETGLNLTANRYRAMGDWMRERFGDDAGRVQQLVFVGRLETHGSRRPVKGSGKKISPECGNAPFEAENHC